MCAHSLESGFLDCGEHHVIGYNVALLNYRPYYTTRRRITIISQEITLQYTCKKTVANTCTLLTHYHALYIYKTLLEMLQIHAYMYTQVM